MRGAIGIDGAVVGPYTLQDCLGHGPGTAVYRAEAAGAEWAVKVVDGSLEPVEELVRRIRRDADLLGEIDQPGIVPIRNVVADQGMAVAAMPLLQATSLRDLMASGELDMDGAWSILSQVAESLDHVHRHGLVCRLLKPANILVDQDGRAHLAEFGVTGGGLGRLAITEPGVEVGAPQYLAPEQLDGREIDYRADVYALGVLAFELATGTPLHGTAATAEILHATRHAPPPSASARDGRLLPEMDLVFQRALAKEPSDRHQSVWELLDELASPPESAVAAPPPAAAQPVFVLLPDAESAVVPGTADVLDTFFLICVRAARQAAGEAWPQVAEVAGLYQYLALDPPHEGRHEPELLALSRLAEAFDAVTGRDSPRRLMSWGALVGDRWLRSVQSKPPWIAGPPTGRLVDLLTVFVESLNRVRGADLQSWTQVNRQLFRVVHQQNMTAVGRRRQTESCHFWRGVYQAALAWAGLTDHWLVAEVECGCVTGAGDCLFTLVRAGS